MGENMHHGDYIIDTAKFLQATRDSGYRTLESALAELVDNSLQAGANFVSIFTPSDAQVSGVQTLAILDDGTGMDERQVRAALQFGGTERFGDRSGIGRFGMGLPNSSLSQARRVDVYSWCFGQAVLHTHLDLDEVLADGRFLLPPTSGAQIPSQFLDQARASGTLIVWSKLDRLQGMNWGAGMKRVARRLGQAFRYYLWDNRAIRINNEAVVAHDPLFLSQRTRTPWITGQLFGEPLAYEVRIGDEDVGARSCVQVRFSELPVAELTDMPNRDKRTGGITNGAGVSIVRAGREIDYGWFLIDKRRENYDDWWRCEIQFSPDLDEHFGVTHTKQGIRPSALIRSHIMPDISSVARTLNRRVRIMHFQIAQRRLVNSGAQTATERDVLLRPLPFAGNPAFTEQGKSLKSTLAYRVAVEEFADPSFIRAEEFNGQVVAILNSMHEFYQNVYTPLLRDTPGMAAAYRKQLDLHLLALARVLLSDWDASQRQVIDKFMSEWSRAIAVFCRETSCVN